MWQAEAKQSPRSVTMASPLPSLLSGVAADNVGISRVGNGEAAHSIVASTGSPKLIVVTMEVVHASLCEHGIVLDLTLAQGRAVVGNQNQLGLALAQSLQGGLDSQAILSTFHHQLQTSIDGVCRLGCLGLLLSGHAADGKP